jgi:AcrR family transcriptional regulator
MSADATTGRDARRVETGERLLRAMESLLEEGTTFRGVSIQRLIDEAGLSRTLFYAYFRNKSDLLLHWAQQVMQATAVNADEWWAIDRAPSVADLHRILDDIVEEYLPHIRVMAAVFDAAEFDEELRGLGNAMMGHYAGHLATHIAAGQHAGWVDPALDPDVASRWLVLALEPVHDEGLWTLERERRSTRLRALAGMLHATLYRDGA